MHSDKTDSPSGLTWLDPEELAYNTRTGGHSRSRRKARVLCSDGRYRTVTVGIPDTYYTIPGHGRINGRYVSGVVYTEDGEFRFQHLFPDMTHERSA
jgi:hypothetical protein